MPETAAIPAPQRRPIRTDIPRTAPRRVKLMDRLAGWVIRFGGIAVILTVAAIFLFVGKEALPLFLPARAEPLLHARIPNLPEKSALLVFGLDEYETYAYWLHPTGAVHLVSLTDAKPSSVLARPEFAGHTISSAARSPARDHLYAGTTDGQVLLTQVKFLPQYSAEGRSIETRLSEGKWIEVSPQGSAIVKIFGRHDSDDVAHFIALTASGKLYTASYEEGDDPKVEPLETELSGSVTAMAIDADGRKVFVATADGKLYHWYLEDDPEKPIEILSLDQGGRHVTALNWAIGNNALLVGCSDGTIEEWFGVREKEGEPIRTFRKIRSFEPLPAAVTQIEPSGRDKGFIAGAADGTVKLYFATSGRTLLTLKTDAAVEALAYSPKLTSILAGTADQELHHWAVRNPHPEISLKTLFGKVWYEGYEKPKYVWQSTGGSDDFESKYSLVPLTLGTLKGAFYGLLFAIPVAVMAAIYTSQFMSYRLRTLVKPGVEIMAALPSVVIGFLAGLWLAPLLEKHVVSAATMFVIIPILALLAVSAWHHLPQRVRSRIPPGMELGLIIPLVIAGFYFSTEVGPLFEGWFFHGDLRQWIFNATGHQFEQRNSIVIGFAMGFAVIPIIFTISEDALSNVPQHFVSGSLALGASRWQTAARIILPTASPGIFSAIMVGFGRAVGETMIVLMATGNTPILSFSPFNGMRTLSANIAVEIPEAPVAGTLYRLLFLTAILLFVMTFVVNTVAEVIRQRLRQKYQAV